MAKNSVYIASGAGAATGAEQGEKVKITVNQVILDPTGNPGGTANAIAIDLSRPGLTGTIDVAQAFSNVNSFTPPPAVPEPSTWAMMLVGFAGLGYTAARRKERVRTVSA